MRGFLKLTILWGALAMTVNAAHANTKVRMSLDWIPGSVHAPFFIALYKGYYKAAGLDVTIDPGKGSVGLVQQMASGVYDMGYPDLSVLADFDSKHPDHSFPMLMVGYEQIPAAVIFLKSSGITKPQQLEGKTLGAAANDGTFRLFPIFAKHAKLDAKKVKIQYIDPKLRESLLAKHSVDAIVGQIFNSVLELKHDGVPESAVGDFMYKDYGLDLYGNGVAASPQFLKAHPDAVKAFLKATIKGFRDMVADPNLAVQMTLKYQPLLDASIERDRLALAMKCCILTPNVEKEGFSPVDQSRLKRMISTLVQGYGLPHTPTAAEIYNGSYLPSRKDLKAN